MRVKLPIELKEFDAPAFVQLPPPLPSGNKYHLGDYDSLEVLMETVTPLLGSFNWRPLTSLELYVLRNAPHLIRSRYYLLSKLNESPYDSDSPELTELAIPDHSGSGSLQKRNAYFVIDSLNNASENQGPPQWVLENIEDYVLQTVRYQYNV